MAATLEIEEAALTGESLPVGKATGPVPGEEVPLGDRTCMAYMNTSVTRGRGEMVVTATGMDTEIGHIANLPDVAATIGFLQRIFETVELTFSQWSIWSIKLVLRQRSRRQAAPAARPAMSGA